MMSNTTPQDQASETIGDVDLTNLLLNDSARIYDFVIGEIDVNRSLMNILTLAQMQSWSIDPNTELEVFDYEMYCVYLEAIIGRAFSDLNLVAQYLYTDSTGWNSVRHIGNNKDLGILKDNLFTYNFKKFLIYYLLFTGTDKFQDEMILKMSTLYTDHELNQIRKMTDYLPESFASKYADWYETLLLNAKK